MPLSDDEDRHLLRGCLDGQGGSWEALWERHAGAMRRAAGRLLGSPAEGEEVLQAVMARLASDGGRALGAFRGDCRLGTWLVAVTLREAADRRQALARERRLPPEPSAAAVPTPLQALCRSEDLGLLRAALDALPPRDRLLLTLRYWDGATHEAAGRLIGVSPSSITTLQNRALGRLREALGKIGGGP